MRKEKPNLRVFIVVTLATPQILEALPGLKVDYCGSTGEYRSL